MILGLSKQVLVKHLLQVASKLKGSLSSAVVVASPAGKNVPGPNSRPAPIDPQPVGVAADQLTLGAKLLVVVPMALAADAAAAAAELCSVDLNALQ